MSTAQAEWTLGSLGGHAHALSVEPAAPHRLAIGCGDGTIRITPTQLRADCADAAETKMIWQVGICGNQPWRCRARSSQPPSFLIRSYVDGSSMTGGHYSALSCRKHLCEGNLVNSVCSSSRLEARLYRHDLVRTQGLTDKVTSVAWHPTKPQLLAFGCDSGAVGTADVASGVATAFTIRHKVLYRRYNASSALCASLCSPLTT